MAADRPLARLVWWAIDLIGRIGAPEIEKRTCDFEGCNRQVARVESTCEDDSEWYCLRHQYPRVN